MRVKNIIADVMAVPVIFGCAGAFPASAGSFIPEVVSVESWTYPYYIDGDTSKPYDELECSAEIYNDGSVRVYFRNLADLSKLAPDDNEEHTVTIKGYSPDIMAFAFANGFLTASTNSGMTDDEYIPISKKMFEEGTARNWTEDDKNFTFWEAFDADDFAFYPTNYRMICNSNNDFTLQPTRSYYYGTVDKKDCNEASLFQFEYKGTLDGLSKKSSVITFRPKEVSKEDSTLVIFGKNIEVFSEMLSEELFKPGYDVSRKVDELTARCDELEAENATLKALNDADSILRLDANNDGIVDSNDASILLTIYAINSTGGNISKFSELPE